MASSLAELEEDKKQYVEQLEIVAGQLKGDPDNAELQTLAQELSDMIAMIDESINDLKPKPKPTPTAAPKPSTPPPAAPPPAPEKWSRENHPAFKKAAPPQQSQPPPQPPHAPEEKDDPSTVTYAVNDSVMAKWVSGDRAFYPARITSMTGSAADRVYTVRFKSYDTTETLRARDIRPMAQKRKADGTVVGAPAASSSAQQPPPPPEPDHLPHSPATGSFGARPPPQATPAQQSSGVVTSAAARINPDAARQQAEAQALAAEGASGKPKFKKIKATKELEAGKNKWQDFNSKSRFAKASHKKDSMFRTPDGVHGRVGFTGSGQPMRKDPNRSRHVYQPNDELD